MDSGIIFVIHSPKKVPQFDGLGLASPVGMHARVTIRQVKVNSIGSKSEELVRRERGGGEGRERREGEGET